jgi:hypothetical protein
MIEWHYTYKHQYDALMPILIELRYRGVLEFWSEIDENNIPYIVIVPGGR